jgi:hypothetical protein
LTQKGRFAMKLKLPAYIVAPGSREVVLGLIAVGVVALLMVLVAWGGHDRQKAVDEIAVAPIATKTAKTQEAEAKAVNIVTEKTHAAITTVRRRTARAVEAVHVALAEPVGDPDRAFYVGMCQSPFYAGTADCVGYGGGSEGGRSPHRP